MSSRLRQTPVTKPIDTIDPVNLKYVLGDIQTNCGNLLHGRLSLM